MSITVQLNATYNDNGGTGAPGDQSLFGFGNNFPITVTIPLRPSSGMRREYHTCIGWSTSSGPSASPIGGSYTYTFDGEVEHTVTLYAVWRRDTAYVNYDANGGNGAPSQQSHSAGTSITLSNTKPTRSGHKFLGWSTSASATSAEYQPGGTYDLYTTTTLYAVWKAIDAYIKVSGAWKQAELYVKVGGTWKKISQAYVKVGGVWKPT